MKNNEEIILSVITPFYNEIDHIDEYYTRVSRTLKNLKDNYEIIAVDDDSHDGTRERLITISNEIALAFWICPGIRVNKRIKTTKLPRKQCNFFFIIFLLLYFLLYVFKWFYTNRKLKQERISGSKYLFQIFLQGFKKIAKVIIRSPLHHTLSAAINC